MINVDSVDPNARLQKILIKNVETVVLGLIHTIIAQSPSFKSFSVVRPMLCGLCRLNKQLSNCPTTFSAHKKS